MRTVVLLSIFCGIVVVECARLDKRHVPASLEVLPVKNSEVAVIQRSAPSLDEQIQRTLNVGERDKFGF